MTELHRIRFCARTGIPDERDGDMERRQCQCMLVIRLPMAACRNPEQYYRIDGDVCRARAQTDPSKLLAIKGGEDYDVDKGRGKRHYRSSIKEN